jgi:creatinine amidohydrolase
MLTAFTSRLRSYFWSLYGRLLWDEQPLAAPHIERIVAILKSRALGSAARVLDAGCGTGNYAAVLARKGFDVVGIDYAYGKRKMNQRTTLKKFTTFMIFLSLPLLLLAQSDGSKNFKGILLENLTWQEAEKILTDSTVVVIPLGAAAKEHGPHLKLNNDWLMAEYLKQRLLEAAEVVIAPTLPYHFYPAFVEYPGSTSLRLETARDLIVDICRSLARFGPRRFYVLNTGVSTLRALQPAAEILAGEKILLHYTNILKVAEPAEKAVSQQEGGTHADEIETSMMLYINPSSVDMSKAAKDYHPGKGPLTRAPNGKGVYSATGIYGDATLATREKGEKVVEAMVEGILKDLQKLRRSKLP